MIRKSIKIAIRRLVTLKVYSSINIGGLAIAISVCLAIILYTAHHMSFDRFIPNGENSYRLISRYGDGTYSTNTFACFADVLPYFPQVQSHTICYDNHNIEEVFIGENEIKINGAIFANDSFMDFFGVKMIQGDKQSINQPNTMLVTADMAEKLFPHQEAIGKTVLIRSFTRNQDSLIAYTIKGIVDALPETSHIKNEMLLSQQGHFEPTVETVKSRKVFGGLIYVKLFPSTIIADLEKSFQAKIEPILGGKHGPPLDAFNHKLQPVYDIHFTQGLNNEMQPTVRRSSLNILLLVGLLIFAIAIVNSVIMHFARTTFNRKSALVIRFHGATKQNMFVQTFIEVFISVSMSFFLAIFLLSSFRLILAEYFFANWIISFQTYTFWLIFFSLFLIVTVSISVLSSLNLLKDETIVKESTTQKGLNAAVPLVIFQFVMVIVLISFALLLNRQMTFIRQKDLGFSSENVLVIKVPQQNAKIHTFRDELLKIPGIINAGTAHHYPGFRLQDMNFSSGGNSFPFKFGYIDQDAVATLDIKPLKYFSYLNDNATDGWLINETFYKHLKSVYSEGQIATGNFPRDAGEADDDNSNWFTVLGVISDFHYASLHSEIDNFAFFIPKTDSRFNRFILARFNQNNCREVISAIEDKMAEIYPGQPINYSFLDEKLNSEYASEQILLKLINAFSILAIFIACLGLLGLSVFMTEKRTKEIGIRKVNGASVYEIMKMLNLVFFKWVGIAFIIATPMAYYASHIWLQNFAYRTALSWWIFILAGMMALIIVFVTVSWQTFKVARRNPVEALKYE